MNITLKLLHCSVDLARNICNINADMQKGKYIFERIKISKNMKRIGIILSLFEKLYFEQINTKYYHYIISGEIKRAKCC